LAGADVDARIGVFGSVLQSAEKFGDISGLEMLLREEEVGESDSDHLLFKSSDIVTVMLHKLGTADQISMTKTQN
jgi:hypothetical protein